MVGRLVTRFVVRGTSCGLTGRNCDGRWHVAPRSYCSSAEAVMPPAGAAAAIVIVPVEASLQPHFLVEGSDSAGLLRPEILPGKGDIAGHPLLMVSISATLCSAGVHLLIFAPSKRFRIMPGCVQTGLTAAGDRAAGDCDAIDNRVSRPGRSLRDYMQTRSQMKTYCSDSSKTRCCKVKAV